MLPKGVLLLKGVSDAEMRAARDYLETRPIYSYRDISVLLDAGDHFENTAHWLCGYCGSVNGRSESKCASCGGDMAKEKR